MEVLLEHIHIGPRPTLLIASFQRAEAIFTSYESFFVIEVDVDTDVSVREMQKLSEKIRNACGDETVLGFHSSVQIDLEREQNDHDEAAAEAEGILGKHWNVLNLSGRIERAFRDVAWLQTVRDITNRTALEMLDIRYFGEESLSELKMRLADVGLSLATN